MKLLPLIDSAERQSLDQNLQEIITYRKSGLSLNHVIGCSLDCAYCVRHFFGNFEMKRPKLLCSDSDAVNTLVNHPYFIPHSTPIQLFNRATDPFLPEVKAHTHNVLKELDRRGLHNLVLIITRADVSEYDILEIEKLRNIRVSILFTYSGLTDVRIEPIAKSGITIRSIKTVARLKERTKLILYWRPIVAGWNDDQESFYRVFQMAEFADAIVFTGYYHRPENLAYLQTINVSLPYKNVERRKFLPKNLEERIIEAYKESGVTAPLFRKTSCGVAYAFGVADYNGHWGVREICDICPESQKGVCSKGYHTPSTEEFTQLLDKYEYESSFLLHDGHIWTEGLGEEKRYHLQHTLGFQIWDIEKPHFTHQHGRALSGHMIESSDKDRYQSIVKEFTKKIVENDD